MEKRKLTVALVGSPNVGKSTLFNALTHMHSHTGNWPGKTVSYAVGDFETETARVRLVDLPGTYSLVARSAEEELTRAYICGEAITPEKRRGVSNILEPPDGALVVCDACSLRRSLRLAVEVAKTGLPLVICINLADEAARRGIVIDADKLSRLTGVPCILCAARSGEGLDELCRVAVMQLSGEKKAADGAFFTEWRQHRERNSESLTENLAESLTESPTEASDDNLAESLALSEELYSHSVVCPPHSDRTDRAIDRVVTGRFTALPCFAALTALVLFITLKAAAPLSDALSFLLSPLPQALGHLAAMLGVPSDGVAAAVVECIVCTADVVCRVCAVMLPPMAIFFPLFTLLEQLGLLPRVAYDFDRCFASCGACGKQALTMLMGLGCNAAGVTGCRIIDSPRERLVAAVTNVFMPCNGRFAVIMSFCALISSAVGARSEAFSLLLVLSLAALGVALSFAASRLLSSTCFAGTPSSFTLELPPYRLPKLGELIVRSVFDRTLRVLGRAVSAAAPAGIVIRLLTHVSVGEGSLLSHIAELLDGVGRAAGLDGVMLCAFILALPAAELVPVLMVMGYTGGTQLAESMSLSAMGELFAASGVGVRGLICATVFTLLHFPCLTTLITLRRETARRDTVLLALILPTAVGYLICCVINALCLALGVP